MKAIECVNNMQISTQMLRSKIANNCPELPRKHQRNKVESLKMRYINLEEPTADQIWNVVQEYKKRRKKIIENYTEDAKLTLVKMSLINGLQTTCKRFQLSAYSIERWRRMFNISISSLADRLSKSNGYKKYSEATKMQIAKISIEEGIDQTCKKYDICFKTLKMWRAKFRKMNEIIPSSSIIKKKRDVKLEEIRENKSKKYEKHRRKTYLAATRKDLARIAKKIGVKNASRKFNIPRSSCKRWVEAGKDLDSNIIPNKRKQSAFDKYPPEFRIIAAKEACVMGQRKAGIAFNIGLKALERWVPAYKNLGFDELMEDRKLHFLGPGLSIKSLGNEISDGRDIYLHEYRGDKEPNLAYSSQFNSRSNSISSILTSEDKRSIKRECSEESTSIKRESPAEGEEEPMEEDLESKVDEILNPGLCKEHMEYQGINMETKLTELLSLVEPTAPYIPYFPTLQCYLNQELQEDQNIYISPQCKLHIVKKLLRKEKNKDINELASAYAINNRILMLWLDHYCAFGEHAVIFKQDQNITDPNKFSIREIIHILKLSLLHKSYLGKTCLDNNLLQSWLKSYFKFNTTEGKWKAPSEIEISIFEEIQKNQLGNNYNKVENNVSGKKDIKYYSPSTKLGIAKMGELKGVATTSKNYGIGEHVVREWFELFQVKGQTAFNNE